MKLSILLASAVLAVAAPGPPPSRLYTQVNLKEPQNWIAAGPLFPDNVIASYSDDYNKYTAESYSKYIRQECAKFSACTSTISFSAINSGNSPKDRFWFGSVFRGGPTTQDNYTRDWKEEDSVMDSIAYNVAKSTA